MIKYELTDPLEWWKFELLTYISGTFHNILHLSMVFSCKQEDVLTIICLKLRHEALCPFSFKPKLNEIAPQELRLFLQFIPKWAVLKTLDLFILVIMYRVQKQIVL